jgi:C4-type Zn-finger protein
MDNGFVNRICPVCQKSPLKYVADDDSKYCYTVTTKCDHCNFKSTEYIPKKGIENENSLR